MNRIKLLGGDVPDRAIDLDLYGLVEVVANSLDLADVERQDGHLHPSIPECLHGLRQLSLLEAVGGKNGHTEASELGHDDSPSFECSYAISSARTPPRG